MDEVHAEKEDGRLERPIVRFESVLQPAIEAPIFRLVVVATAQVGSDILCMEAYCGDLWRDRDDPKAYERATETRQEIVRRCTQLGLELRGGIVEKV